MPQQQRQMEINKTLTKNSSLVLALGFFDGIHAAHQKLIEKAVFLSRENGLESAVITFDRAPSSIILNKREEYITLNPYKIKLIESMGIDKLFILDFNKFKNMRANDYIKNVIIKYFNPKFVITGFNHTFGFKKEGNGELLSEYYNDFQYIQIPSVKINGLTVSSTLIKNFIKQGDIKEANAMLKRTFSVKGKVVAGAQIARKLGYKTANIIWNQEIVKPKYGVYEGYGIYQDKKYPALINFGIRPSVDKELKETLEVHLLGFNLDIYNKEIEVGFNLKIRDEKKFSSLEELKNQIDNDFKSLKHNCGE